MASEQQQPQSELTTSKYLSLFVKGWEGKTMTLGEKYLFTPETKVRRLKEIVSTRTGIDAKDMVLIYASKQLSENYEGLTFGDIGIMNNSTIMMVARLRGGLELLIKLANDEELKMDVDSSITVGRLKEMIAKRNSILGKESMCLTCAGIVYKDE